jgi:hypothetical protein
MPATSTQRLPLCTAGRNAGEHYLLVLPFIGLGNDDASAVGGVVAALMVLVVAAVLWSRGWGAGDAIVERRCALGWTLAWWIGLAFLGASLGAGRRTVVLAALVGVGGIGAIAVEWARRARVRLAARPGACYPTRKELLAGAILLGALLVLEALRRFAGGTPAENGTLVAVVLAVGALVALARRGRVAPSELES